MLADVVRRRDPLCRTRLVNLAVHRLAAFGSRIPKAAELMSNVYGLVTASFVLEVHFDGSFTWKET